MPRTSLPSILRRSAAGAYAAIGVVAALAPARVPALFGGAAGTAVARLAGCVAERRPTVWPSGAFLALEAGLAVALRVARRPGAVGSTA